MLCPSVKARLAQLKPTDAVIFGVEAHVCVQQTVLDLLPMGCRAHLCVDAISSQQTIDRSVGLRRAEQAGAHPARARHPTQLSHSTRVRNLQEPCSRQQRVCSWS